MLRDADEEAVDDVEADFEQEVEHGEDAGLVDADPMDSKVGEVEQTHKEPEAQAKRKKRNSIRTAGKEKQLSCDQAECTKTFRGPLDLKQHINVNEKPFMCNAPGCTKKFRSKYSLNRHTANIHLKERPFKCEVNGCSKDFGSKDYLNNHMAQVHFVKEKLRCSYAECTAVFTQTGNLTTHIRAVHLKEKPYNCLEHDCGKKFSYKQKLEDHLRHAHGALKLACKQTNCTAVFNSSSRLAEHIRSVHLKERRFIVWSRAVARSSGATKSLRTTTGVHMERQSWLASRPTALLPLWLQANCTST